jgi:hypothetical protein
MQNYISVGATVGATVMPESILSRSETGVWYCDEVQKNVDKVLEQIRRLAK